MECCMKGPVVGQTSIGQVDANGEIAVPFLCSCGVTMVTERMRHEGVAS